MDSLAKIKFTRRLEDGVEHESVYLDEAQTVSILDSFNRSEWESVVADLLSGESYLYSIVGQAAPNELTARLLYLINQCSPKSILQLSRVLLSMLQTRSADSEELLSILSGIIDYVDYRDVRSFTTTEGIQDDLKESVTLMLTGRSDIPGEFWLTHPEISNNWYLSSRIAVAYNNGPEAMLFALKDYNKSYLSGRLDVQNALKLAVHSILLRFDGVTTLNRVLDSLPDVIAEYVLDQISEGDYTEFADYMLYRNRAAEEIDDDQGQNVYSIQGNVIDSVRKGDHEESLAYHLSALAMEVRSLLSNNKKEYRMVIEAIGNNVGHFAATPYGKNINAAFLSSLEKSECPIIDLSKVQYEYYRSLYDHYSSTENAHDEMKEWLSGFLSNLPTVHYGTPDNFKICAMPYAEGAYLFLFYELCRLYFGDMVELVEDVAWADVGHKLSNGDISFAISNPDAITSVESNDDSVGVVALKRHPCYMMNTFDMLVRIDHLKQVAKETDSVSIKEKIEKIIQGESLGDLSVDKEDSEELFATLFKSGQSKVSTLGYSILSKAVERLRKEFGIAFTEELTDSTTGLVNLLEGRVEYYVGGTIHSFYAQEVFKNRVVRLGLLKEEITGTLYMNESMEKEYPQFSQTIKKLWSRLTHAWKTLQDSNDNDYVNVKNIILNYVNVELSNPNNYQEQSGLSVAKASSFPSLVRMLERSKLISYKGRDMGKWVSVTSEEIEQEKKKLNPPIVLIKSRQA